MRPPWRKRRSEWVERLVALGYPQELMEFCDRMISAGKTHVAAYAVIEYLKKTDPEARRQFEEFEALPPEEKKRRSAEAMAQADADIAREKGDRGRPWMGRRMD